jgi:D-arginine dehydrogenase
VEKYDVIVIGAGMAGLSAAYALAKSARVLVLEQEESPGYHSTGRSAAVYASSYGSDKPVVNALTKASHDFFQNPPPGFSEYPLLSDRGVLIVAHENDAQDLEKMYLEQRENNPQLKRVSQPEAESLVPVLLPEFCTSAFYDKDVFELDVNAVQQGYIRGLRERDGELVTGFEVDQLRYENQGWLVSNRERSFAAPVVVNAAGAWVDEIAVLAGVNPIGIQPLRRSVILIDPPLGLDTDDWPMVVEFQEQFYFKPEAGKILVSSANEDPSAPCDVRPEEIDIAYAAHYFGEATNMEVKRVSSSWAGLRNFVKDRSPVLGFDADSPGFFWLAGQGGYGIQTAPAAGRLAASLILEDEISKELSKYRLHKDQLSASRLA